LGFLLADGASLIGPTALRFVSATKKIPLKTKINNSSLKHSFTFALQLIY